VAFAINYIPKYINQAQLKNNTGGKSKSMATFKGWN
jgi:hypothetical protein